MERMKFRARSPSTTADQISALKTGRGRLWLAAAGQKLFSQLSSNSFAQPCRSRSVIFSHLLCNSLSMTHELASLKVNSHYVVPIPFMGEHYACSTLQNRSMTNPSFLSSLFLLMFQMQLRFPPPSPTVRSLLTHYPTKNYVPRSSGTLAKPDVYRAPE